MDDKIKIGIDVNEILRALWFKFDYMYHKEFGDPDDEIEAKYTYNFFEDYKWEDVEEEISYLREDAPEDINPLDYKVDPETGEAPVDFLLFEKKEEKIKAEDVYKRFLYEDYLFEIFGAATLMYKNADVDINHFIKKYKNHVEFIVLSKENELSIPPTLFFLSKNMMRFRHFHFVEDVNEYWKYVDILITTDPNILNNGEVPDGKKIIKLNRPYNTDCKIKGEIDEDSLYQLNDLNGHPKFEKLINFPQDKDSKEIEEKNYTEKLKEEIK
jgi:hypothetical protein